MAQGRVRHTTKSATKHRGAAGIDAVGVELVASIMAFVLGDNSSAEHGDGTDEDGEDLHGDELDVFMCWIVGGVLDAGNGCCGGCERER